MSDHPLAHAITKIVDETPEDIDEVIIIAKGKCHKCQKRDGITVVSSITDFDQFADLLVDAARYAYVRGIVSYGVDRNTYFNRILNLLTPDADDATPDQILDLLTPDDDDRATLG